MRLELIIVTVTLVSSNAFSVHTGNVQEKLRLLNPAFMMMEQLFNLQDENQCIEKMFCLLETEMANDINNPLKYYSRFLTNTYKEIEPIAFEKLQSVLAKYPHLSKITDAITLGQAAGDSKTCNERYEGCGADQTQLVEFAKSMGDESVLKILQDQHDVSKRGDEACTGVKIGCSIAGGSCAACAILTEGACAAICVPALGAGCAGVKLGCILG